MTSGLFVPGVSGSSTWFTVFFEVLQPIVFTSVCLSDEFGDGGSARNQSLSFSLTLLSASGLLMTFEARRVDKDFLRFQKV